MLTCSKCGSESPDGARFCSTCGPSLGAPRPVEGERRLATILFADVARSTALAEALDPEDWAGIMNGAFSFMNAAVERYEGTVSRLMGDAVLALFGAPVAHEDDAERAVRTALEIRADALEYAAAMRDRYGIDFGLRIGVHTGVAVVAFLGDEIKTEYTAMGDAANVAARLQSVAEPGTILISGDTARLVKGAFELHEHGAVELKGKQAPVESFEVLAARAVRGRSRGLEGLSSPIVGRDGEIASLGEKLEGIRAGVGAVVAILGEAGVGKSRLVAELRALSEAVVEGPVACYEGRAISYGRALAYYPWQQIGRQFIGVGESAGLASVRERLHAFHERLGLPASDLPFLETMLAVDSEESRKTLTGLDRDTVTHGVADAVIRCIHASIGEGDGVLPHLLVFDDLHWADGASLELLAHVATTVASSPILLVCVLRPDRRAESRGMLDRLERTVGASFLRLELRPLAAGSSRELLRNLLDVEDLPDEVRDLILTRSEGNPFFLEEVLRSLIDAGRIVRENGRWRATADIVDATVPETLAGVLGARIDRLPDTTKRVAQTAAVLGRIFQYRALDSVCRSAPPPERIDNVDPHLGTLTYEELVRERARDPEREYIFKHALTCDAAYSLLLKRRRRELHLRAGNALEQLYPERLEELAPILAHHFFEAGEAAVAARHAMRAGARALKLYAIREALEHYDAALAGLEALPDPEPSLLIDAALAWTFARYRADDYEGVLERLSPMEELARSLEDESRLARVLTWIANVHVLTGFPSRSMKPLMESYQLAKELEEEELMLLPFFFTTESMLDRDPQGAATNLEELIAQARAHGAFDIEGHATALMAIAHARMGSFDEADGWIARALAMAPHVGSGVKEADIHIALGTAYVEMGKLDKGVEEAETGARLANAVGAMECACAGNMGVGIGQLERHELDGALSAFARSLEFANRAGWGDGGKHAAVDGWVNRIRAGHAAASFHQGAGDALAELDRALADAGAGGDDHLVAEISERLARAHLELDDPEQAERHTDTAIDYYRRTGMRPALARTLELSARIHERRALPDEARGLEAEADSLRAAFRAAGAL